MSRVILASASPIRAELLKRAGVDVIVEPALVDEATIRESLKAEGASVEDVADALAETKASQVGRRNPDDLVVGCDQMLDLGGDWLEKPGTLENAKTQLAQLAGRTHRLVSSAVVVQGRQRLWGATDSAQLSMRKLNSAAIEAYLAAAGPDVLGSVGCYQIEKLGIRLFDRIQGDHFTILGMPLLALMNFLRMHGHGV